MDTLDLPFAADAPPSPAAERRLVVRVRSDRPLSAPQKTFNRLVTKLERLRAALETEKSRLERALVFHAEQVRPRVARAAAARADLVRALAPLLDDRRLAKRDRRDLHELLASQLDDVLAHGEALDDDLRALFERLHGTDLAALEQDEMEASRAAMEEMFAELGVEVDLSDFHADMAPEDAAAKAAELADEIRRRTEAAQAHDRSRPRTARERKAEQQAAHAEALRKSSLGAVYRRLAKELHPDLEQDAAERARKGAVMREVTAAHARGDLYALLRLELEWNLRDDTDVSRLADETLQAYNRLLKEQAGDLEQAIRGLAYHPRYQPLEEYLDPFGRGLLFDGPLEVRRLDALLEALAAALVPLRGRDALGHVRSVIRLHRATR